jgi:hypothetical protein
VHQFENSWTEGQAWLSRRASSNRICRPFCDEWRRAGRLREKGLVVHGFDEKKTPDAFVAACDKFI